MMTFMLVMRVRMMVTIDRGCDESDDSDCNQVDDEIEDEDKHKDENKD